MIYYYFLLRKTSYCDKRNVQFGALQCAFGAGQRQFGARGGSLPSYTEKAVQNVITTFWTALFGLLNLFQLRNTTFDSRMLI